ncbi:MAG TPA: nicotinate-nucleotide--dimethylbenzimidazole phosphoribosyltransferase [Methylibium sp.]|uniref:nicotinate-nucleotide--dimethylbenzimidazole phosphoribosyltransferase n=1 Tax=Methylibium sp. TaxID=2067992 RepID=UPI002DB621AE|nr:nicotinate-nucleotide--dimethylbenzimidazole phosphoribosyltransferase [Methylibium sp.]HEU4459193.1 nicotinate-nucleotide--dimethylbenzimidazole phosphoribosyltransferase [Methylibium sp.]
MAVQRSLIAPTNHPRLEEALRQKLHRRAETAGSLGELEPLAVRLGLIQNTLKPRLKSPQLLVFAGDHGIVVEGLTPPGDSTVTQVLHLLQGRLPMAVFSFIQGMGLTIVDAGLAEPMNPHPSLLQRKIGFGTRNAKVTSAMSVDQAHAAIRAGMEIGDTLSGNALACAAIGIGSQESAALVISRLADVPVRDLGVSGPDITPEAERKLLEVLEAALARHRDVTDPVEVLAAFGGFEIAMLVGAMLVAASKRHLIMVDGLPACAALLVAARIAAPVTDYVVFCRSHSHQGLDHALALFRASALLELGMESTDGTGATLAWPLIHSAAALLTEVAEGDEPGATNVGPATSTPSVSPADIPTLEAAVEEAPVVAQSSRP